MWAERRKWGKSIHLWMKREFTFFFSRIISQQIQLWVLTGPHVIMNKNCLKLDTDECCSNYNSLSRLCAVIFKFFNRLRDGINGKEDSETYTNSNTLTSFQQKFSFCFRCDISAPSITWSFYWWFFCKVIKQMEVRGGF